jgi:Leucine-rich repeat (LRR) protein
VIGSLTEHPDWKDLQAYGQGRLPPETIVALEEHLAGCANCCELLAKAPTDNFLSQLRAAEDTLPHVPDIPPQLIDHPRYRVLGRISQGGMGAVYRAEHRHMERLVALKIIHPGLLRNPAAVPRFQQEMRAAARLRHANIVTAHDADQAGGLHFLVMEYVEGTSLAELVREHGPLPIADACSYARQAALGLQHAHEQGMVHRDIKPQNLMLQDGVIKILDFGLARLAQTAEGPPMGEAVRRLSGPLTGVGAMMGTADYIAPEQAADPRSADIRADLYSLGCTLFHLLTGQPPFADAAMLEKLARHADTLLPLVISLRPEAPAGLDGTLARMTAKDPANRYRTPAEVAEALAPFCPAGAAPLPRPRRLWPAAALTLLAAGLLGGFLVLSRGGDRGEGVPPNDDRNLEPIVHENPLLKAEEAADRTAQAIQKLKGQITRDYQAPGKPVVSVRLLGPWVTDANLQLLADSRQLRSLTLDRAPITDAGLEHLAGLTKLSGLVLSGTRVTDAGMKSVGEMKELHSLDLMATAVGDSGLKDLAGLTQLRTLSLSATKVTDAGMSVVGQLKNLTVLTLDDTTVTDVGLKILPNLTELSNLGLHGCRDVGDEGMKSVGQLKKMRSLNLYTTGVTDQGLKELAGLTRICSIQLGNLKVGDAGLQALAGLTDLQMLDLANTEVTDIGLKEAAKHRRLTHLNLIGVKTITDAGVKELAGLPKLQYLVLEGTNITDAAIKDLTPLPQLQHLILTKTSVTDAGIQELARCPRLAHLSLVGEGKVTDAGVVKLHKARPKLKIQH